MLMSVRVNILTLMSVHFSSAFFSLFFFLSFQCTFSDLRLRDFSDLTSGEESCNLSIQSTVLINNLENKELAAVVPCLPLLQWSLLLGCQKSRELYCTFMGKCRRPPCRTNFNLLIFTLWMDIITIFICLSTQSKKKSRTYVNLIKSNLILIFAAARQLISSLQIDLFILF